MDASLHGQAAMAAKGLSVEEYLRAALPGTSSSSSSTGNGGNSQNQSPEVAAFEEKEATRRIRSAVGEALASLAGAQTLGAVGGGPEHPGDDSGGGGDRGEKLPLLDEVLEFVLSEGLADPAPQVRESMLGAGTSLVDAYAPDAHHASNLLAILEAHMSKNADRGAASASGGAAAVAPVSSSKKDKGKASSSASAAASKEDPIVLGDRRREGTVALLGTIAKHLDKGDPKVVNENR